MGPIIYEEIIIHVSAPMHIVPLRFTIYQKGVSISDSAHELMSHKHPDYDWFIVCQMDGQFENELAVLRGRFWAGYMKDQDEEYYQLLASVRDTILIELAERFPLIDDDEDEYENN